MAEKELDLVNKVELRIALADTDLKFQNSLDTYLAPLLLKLVSPYREVRQEIFKFIQHLMTRINSSRICLPVLKLIQQAKAPKLPANAESPLNVQLYSLLFAAKGIDALSKEQAYEIIPIVIDGISRHNSLNVQARMFNVFIKLLKFCPRVNYVTHPDVLERYRKHLHMTEDDEKYLLSKLEPLMVLDHAVKFDDNIVFTKGTSCNGVSPDEINFLTYDAGVALKIRELRAYKVDVSHFLMVFQPTNAALCVLFGAADIDLDVSNLNTFHLKHVRFKLEDELFINHIYDLFLGDVSSKRSAIDGVYQFDMLQMILCPSKVAINSDRALRVIEVAFSKTKYRVNKFPETYTFIRNIINHSTNPKNKSVESLNNVLSLVKNRIQSNGWPKADIAPGAFYVNEVTQRNTEYELIGEILSKDSRLLENLSFIEFLFDSLAGEISDVKSSVKDALGSISMHVGKLPNEFKIKLKKIIRNYMKDFFTEDQQTVAEVRFLSLKLLNTAFSFDDSEAKFLNVLGCSPKNRHDVINEAKIGLNPYFIKLIQSPVNTKSNFLGTSFENQDFVNFEEYVDEFAKAIRFAEERPSSSIHTVLDKVFDTGVLSIVSQAVAGRTTSIIQDEEWETRITRGLTCDPVIIDGTRIEIFRLIQAPSNSISKFLRLILKEYIKSFDQHHPFDPASISDLIPVFLGMVPSSTIASLLDFIPPLCEILRKTDSFKGNSLTVLPQIIGILSSHSEFSSRDVSDLVDDLLADYRSDPKKKKTAILLTTLGEIIQKLYARQRYNVISPNSLGSYYNVLKAELNSTSTILPKLVSSILSGLLRYGGFGPVIDDSVITELNQIKTDIIEILNASLNKFGPAGYHSLALSTLSDPESKADSMTVIEEKLLDSYETKDIDVLFSIGEALSIICEGWESKLLKFSDCVQDDKFSTNTLTRQGIRTSVILEHLFAMTKQTKPTIRRASCIWLLALVQYCAESTVILDCASKIHMYFMIFLTDPDEVVQEAASRGLGIVYDLGDNNLKETLVKSLLRSFADATSGSKLLTGTVDKDTELFEPGVLKTYDGSVSTYKDILSLASEVGDPSLVYKFMSLAKTSALWSSRRGIAFGLGNVMSKASLSKLLVDNPIMAKRLIPKLYRYRFDPNSLVCQSMDDIWKTLVPDSSKVIECYSGDILNELLSSMGKNEWRVRQAATTALTDFLQIIKDDFYNDRTEEIWTMGFRALDDIKESVRKAAGNLTRSLSKALIQSMKTEGSPERSQSNIKRLLLFLLGPKGISCDSDDVRDFALETIVTLIKSAGKSIKPFIGELIEHFIMLMSTLEPQIMNYLALNAQKYKVESDFIDSRRAQSLISSPIMDSIERLIDLSDEENIEEIVSKLGSSVKSSVGLPSKFAGSKIVVSLVLRHYHIIKPYGDALLTTCTARLNDSNNTVSSSYAVAAGYVCRVASVSAVIKYSKKLRSLYFGTKSTPPTIRSKRIAGTASQAVSKHSGERFSEVASAFLPVAFICKNDDVEDVAKAFEFEWSENTSGVGAIKLYLQEIIDLGIKYFDSTDYSIRKVIVRSITKAFDAMETVTNEEILEPLLQSLIDASRSNYWTGKEDLIASMVSVSLKSKEYFTDHEKTFDAVKKAIIKSSQSNKQSYVVHTIRSLGKFVGAFPSKAIYEESITSFVKRLELQNKIPLVNSSDSDGDSDEEMIDPEKAKKIKSTIHQRSTQENLSKENSKLDTIKSLSDCFQLYKGVEEYHHPTLELILKELESSFSPASYEPTWRTYLGIVECLKMITSILVESRSFESDRVCVDLLRDCWKVVINQNFRSDSIENVKVQSVRLGKSIIDLKIMSLGNDVENDLKKLLLNEASTIVKVEIENLFV